MSSSDFTAQIRPISLPNIPNGFTICTHKVIPGAIISREVEDDGMVKIFRSRGEAVDHCLSIGALVLC